MLYAYLGVAVLMGVTLMVLLVGGNMFVLKLVKRYQTANMEFKDYRMRLLAEMARGIRPIKMLAWEPCFIEMISNARMKEFEALRKFAFLNAIQRTLYDSVPVF